MEVNEKPLDRIRKTMSHQQLQIDIKLKKRVRRTIPRGFCFDCWFEKIMRAKKY